MITTILKILAALAPAAAALVVWYIKSRPEAKAKKKREQNAEIHNAVADRDVGYIRKLLNKLRAED